MAQINIYVSKSLEAKLRKEAERQMKSISAIVVEAIEDKIEPSNWSQDFLNSFGSWTGDSMTIKDLPLEKRQSLSKIDES